MSHIPQNQPNAAEEFQRAVEVSLQIRLEREDDIPAFGAYLNAEAQNPDSHVILMNVQACMNPVAQTEDGTAIAVTREERLRLIITSIMHEFGHALESHFRLPVNEVHIQRACEEWESAFAENEMG